MQTVPSVELLTRQLQKAWTQISQDVPYTGVRRCREAFAIASQIHLFAIEDGQSSKLFERRSKTRHTSQSWCKEISRCAQQLIAEIGFQFVIEHIFNIVRKEWHIFKTIRHSYQTVRQGAFHSHTRTKQCDEINCSLAKQFEDAESYAQCPIYYHH